METELVQVLQGLQTTQVEILKQLQGRKVKSAKASAVQKDTYRNEKIVRTVQLKRATPTQAGNGVMALFGNETVNYSVFVQSKRMEKLAYGKEYKVTEHKRKSDGNISHAIWISQNIAKYTKAK